LICGKIRYTGIVSAVMVGGLFL